MRSLKKFTALILTAVMVVSNINGTMIGAATAKATTLRLEQTEGTATLKNANGTAKTIKAGMKLYNGDDLSTNKSSYAYISLDSSKAVKMDESSSVTIKQSGTQNEVFVNSGSLMFNVTVPLAKKESLNIRTSTMVTGVRGTIGFAEKISEEESEIYILEGKVELTSIDSKTGNSKSVFIQAGEKGVCRRVKAKFDKKSDVQVPEVVPQKFTEENIPEFVIIEIGRNLDIQNRLRKVGVLDVDKILAIYRRLGDKGTYITLGTPVTSNSVSPNRPAVTSNTATDNTSGGSGGSGGGGGGGGGGGSSSGGNSNTNTQASAPTITTASVHGGGQYTYGDTLSVLSVAAEISNSANAVTTYQWYMADDAVSEGTAVPDATGTEYSPQSVIGTKYYYCVVTSKASADAKTESKKESNRVEVTVEKQTQVSVTAAPAEPVDQQIGFTSITLDPVTTLASVGFSGGQYNAEGGKITLASTKHSEMGKLRVDTLVLNAPGETVSEDEVEYAKSLTTTAPTDDTEWQKSRTFTGLSQGTTYYFFARLAATDYVKAGNPSAPITVTTKSGAAFTDVVDDENLLHYIFDLSEYNGTVSANAAVECVSDNNGSGTTTVDNIEIPSAVTLYDIDIKVTKVADYGFATNNNISKRYKFENVVLPDTIEEIGEYAFGQTELESINIPDSVKIIGEKAFYICDSLSSIEIGKACETIGADAFSWCQSLQSVKIGDGVTTICGGAFNSCTGITELTLGKNVQEIENGAFYGCTGLTKITFNDKLEIIGPSAFSNCTELTKAELCEGVKSIGKDAFENDNKITEVMIPGSVESLGGENGNSIFMGCSSMMKIYCVGNKARHSEKLGEDWYYYSDTSRCNVYWYEPDEEDPQTAYVYSPDVKLSGVNITSLDSDAVGHTYTGFISTVFLNKMFTVYNTVIIPKDNIAILDSDLTIPEGKTLIVKGDMSTETFSDFSDGYINTTTIPEDAAYGTLTNKGHLIVQGNLYTANNKMNCTSNSTGGDITAYSTIVSKTGTVEVSGQGHISVFFATIHAENNVGTINDRVGLDISDIVITESGKIDIYGYDGGNDWDHHTAVSANIIEGLAVDPDPFSSSKNSYTLSRDSDASATESFGLNYSCSDNTTGGRYHHEMKIQNGSDDSKSGFIYIEEPPSYIL